MVQGPQRKTTLDRRRLKATRIFETVLYAEDLAEAEKFYRDVLGLEVVSRAPAGLAFRCNNGVFLVLDPEKTRTLDRKVPKTGADGPGHVAFAARTEDLDAWRSHLGDRGVEIETEVEWDEGGISIYFRDPAGNSVELAPPTLWGGGWDS